MLYNKYFFEDNTDTLTLSKANMQKFEVVYFKHVDIITSYPE